jgi:hypothetical protein
VTDYDAAEEAFTTSLKESFSDMGLIAEGERPEPDKPEPATDEDPDWRGMTVDDFRAGIVDAQLPHEYDQHADEAEEVRAETPSPLREIAPENVSAEELRALEGFLSARPDLEAALGRPSSPEEQARNVALVRELYRGTAAQGVLGEQLQADAAAEQVEAVEDLLADDAEPYHVLDEAVERFGAGSAGFEAVWSDMYEQDPQAALDWRDRVFLPRAQAVQAQVAAQTQAAQQAAYQQQREKEFESWAEFLANNSEKHGLSRADGSVTAAGWALGDIMAQLAQAGHDIGNADVQALAIRSAKAAAAADAKARFVNAIGDADGTGIHAGKLEGRRVTAEDMLELERLAPPETVTGMKEGLGPEPTFLEKIGYTEEVMDKTRKAHNREVARRRGLIS